jgi:cystathionine gamma-synthase
MGDDITNGAAPNTAAEPELVQGMAHESPLDTNANGADSKSPSTRLQHLSLSSQTIHADDYLNSHQAVAPPMHVSTTFRYNRNPDELKPWSNVNVRPSPPSILLGTHRHNACRDSLSGSRLNTTHSP